MIYYILESAYGGIALFGNTVSSYLGIICDVQVDDKEIIFSVNKGIVRIPLKYWPAYSRKSFTDETVQFQTVDEMIMFVKSHIVGESL